MFIVSISSLPLFDAALPDERVVVSDACLLAIANDKNVPDLTKAAIADAVDAAKTITFAKLYEFDDLLSRVSSDERAMQGEGYRALMAHKVNQQKGVQQ
ncbi:hypothetical protein WK99_27985 [Burkholderia ubonensis]|nr:hypothetical protein WK99_27985 [Burkholderia ubonensis]